MAIKGLLAFNAYCAKHKQIDKENDVSYLYSPLTSFLQSQSPLLIASKSEIFTTWTWSCLEWNTWLLALFLLMLVPTSARLPIHAAQLSRWSRFLSGLQGFSPWSEWTGEQSMNTYKSKAKSMFFGGDLHCLQRLQYRVGREDKKTSNRTRIPNLKTMQLQVIRVQWKQSYCFCLGFFWLNYRIQGHLFLSFCMRIASIVLCVVLQNMPTPVRWTKVVLCSIVAPFLFLFGVVCYLSQLRSGEENLVLR